MPYFLSWNTTGNVRRLVEMATVPLAFGRQELEKEQFLSAAR
jgi:hypothetical protein